MRWRKGCHRRAAEQERTRKQQGKQQQQQQGSVKHASLVGQGRQMPYGGSRSSVPQGRRKASQMASNCGATLCSVLGLLQRSGTRHGGHMPVGEPM